MLSFLVEPTIYINTTITRTLKKKVLHFNADILFNQQCLIKVLIHNYLNITTPNTFSDVKYTKSKEQRQRLNYEIKFNFIKGKYKRYSCFNCIYLFIN